MNNPIPIQNEERKCCEKCHWINQPFVQCSYTDCPCHIKEVAILPQPEEWMVEFDKKFFLKEYGIKEIGNGYREDFNSVKSFIQKQIDKARQETLEECRKIVKKFQEDYYELYGNTSAEDMANVILDRLNKL